MAKNTDHAPKYANKRYGSEDLGKVVSRMKVFTRGYTAGGRETVLYTVKTTLEDFVKFRSLIFFDNGDRGVSATVMGRILYLGALILGDESIGNNFEHIDGDRRNFVKSNLRRL